MKTFTETFNCRYPIACMAMNRVSDLKLALAVRAAGCLPSLSVFNYYVQNGSISFLKFEHDIVQYAAATGDTSILVSTDVRVLVDSTKLVDVLLQHKVAIVEIILDDDHVDAEIRKQTLLPERISRLRANGTLVFFKTLSNSDLIEEATDGVILKGADGAGRADNAAAPLAQEFEKLLQRNHSEKIIVSGGVGTSSQLKYYMDRGAFGVGIGTMFAVSAESKISTDTKLKLVASGAADIQRLKNGQTEHNSQNAIVFGEVENDNHNNTHGLRMGMISPTVGHVFIGRGIEHANEILTCEQIVQRLVKDL